MKSFLIAGLAGLLAVTIVYRVKAAREVFFPAGA